MNPTQLAVAERMAEFIGQGLPAGVHDTLVAGSTETNDHPQVFAAMDEWHGRRFELWAQWKSATS